MSYNLDMLGFYVHIPFCLKKCHYCNFVVTGAGVRPKEEKFLELFEKEAAHAAPVLRSKSFDTLYLGGGTPSALAAEDLERVFSVLRRYFRFRKNIEVTLEANPGDLTPAKARFLRSAGVNRVSLGVQTFHDRTLASLNRAHGAAEIRTSFNILRREGFRNISVDLMLSLPGETLDDVKHTLQETARLDPEHVSLYELVVESGTVFGRRSEKGQLVLPPEEAQLEMLTYARKFLKTHGFRHYELLSYAKPARESSHNLIYWANQEYLGLGPGAFSYLGGRRYRGSSSFDEYMRKSEAGDWSACEEEILSAEKKETESFLLALRKTEGVPASKFRNFLRERKDSVSGLVKKGLVENKNGKIRLTEHGQLFAETVFSELSAQ